MNWANFKFSDFECKCCRTNLMRPEFIDKLQAIRTRTGVVMPVSSGYRCPAHNMRVSSTGPDGPHTTGRAVDIRVERASAVTLLCEAMKSGMFTGYGIQQKGTGRFLHLDDLDLPHPRPNIWSY